MITEEQLMRPIPNSITNDILALCRELVVDPKPVFIRVTPEPGAESLDCFPAVEGYVEQHGGSVCCGWQIWRVPGFMVEAEFHAVWRDPNGRLHDVTPKQTSIDRILFLPDPERKYDGRQVNNVRRPLRDDPKILSYFEECDREFELLNRGERAYQHGAIQLVGDEAEEMRRIQDRKERLTIEIMQPLLGIGEPISKQEPVRKISRPGRNDPCYCGSGKKYKKCCG